MTTDLTRLTAAHMAQEMAAGRLSAVELTTAHLQRIDAVDDQVHAFLHVAADAALRTAAQVDARRAAGERLPALAGIPVAVKDLICTADMPTTCASRILAGWVPPYDATVVGKLRAAGMPILGKVNLDEFAMGTTTEHSAFGVTRNPWDLDRIPGGSSGGSAAAVAAFEAPVSLGTDTGGSIRYPAAMTGCVGVKPTYGGVSRYGLVAMASSLDQCGPFGRTVLDTALLHEAIAGHDPRDSTSIDAPVPPLVAAATSGQAAGVRVGVIKELTGEGYQAGVQARFDEAVAALAAAGAQIVEVSCPNFRYALGAYYLIMPSEVSSNLARFDAMRYGLRLGPDGVDAPDAEQVMAATRAAGFGKEVQRRILLGTYALSSGYYDAYYGTAQKVRRLIADDFARAFEHADVLISPTAPTTAFRLGEQTDDPVTMYLNDIDTIPANLAGLPAMSVPAGLADGLPVGVQLIAPAMRDDRLYAIGAALERSLADTWGGVLLDRAPALTTRTADETEAAHG